MYKLGKFQNSLIERYMVIGVYNTGELPPVFSKITKEINKVLLTNFSEGLKKIIYKFQ